MTIKAPVTITELKSMAKTKDLQAVVILTVSRDGVVSVVTYGETKEKCKAIGDWGQGLWDHAVSIIPFQTVFGWGNKGVPLSTKRPCPEGLSCGPCQYCAVGNRLIPNAPCHHKCDKHRNKSEYVK